MKFLAILLFLSILFLFGYSVSYFIKREDNPLEKFLMNFGLGVGVFPVVAALFAILHIPLYWWIFLIISAIIPSYAFYKYLKLRDFTLPLPESINLKELYTKIKNDKLYIYIFLMLLIFAFTFNMYYSGSMKYPWLEDDDSWIHAGSVNYIAETGLGLEPVKGLNAFQYLDAYPIAYDVLLSIPYQINGEMMWNMKFFNALLISLGIIFFFFFAKTFMRSNEKGIFATFMLAAVPAYMTHFIWAHSYLTAAIFPAFYALEKIRDNHHWKYAAVLMTAGLLTIQPTQALKLLIMIGVYIVFKLLLPWKSHKPLIVGTLIGSIGGIITSLIVWWIPSFVRYGKNFLCLGLTTGTCGVQSKVFDYTQNFTGDFHFIGIRGSATRLYYFKDFFIAQKQGMINTSVGIGVVVCILAILGLLFMLWRFRSFSVLRKEEESWKFITICWFIFTLLGLYGGTLIPFALYSFRFWMLFAIPTVLLAAEGFFLITKIGRQIDNDLQKYIQLSFVVYLVIVVGLAAGVWYTSGIQKYTINTSIWPYNHQFTSMQEEVGYQWLKTLPDNTNVFPICDSHLKTISYDTSFNWNDESIIAWRDNSYLNKTSEEFHSFLKNNSFEYFIVGALCFRHVDQNDTLNMLGRVSQSQDKFQIAYAQQNQLPIIFKVI